MQGFPQFLIICTQCVLHMLTLQNKSSQALEAAMWTAEERSSPSRPPVHVLLVTLFLPCLFVCGTGDGTQHLTTLSLG